ncbi:putative lipoprotein YerB [Vallitalea longa]|uniref:Lipoprotein YerB n=1 Tax=Vallitalea longa TaxID=2936439 RepID=A0A9W6DF12_9FIRM|nr:DUF3048 domain-containing protein [Vallitalea longa]GKX30090.1 putative lipoprotein YerB [Vallitalea longa]
MNKPLNKVLITITLAVITLTMLTITGCKKDKVSEDNTNDENNTKASVLDILADNNYIDITLENGKNTEEKDNREGKVINTLTGLWISEEAANRRPIGIMINNLKAAMPQSGIAQADIVYETLVEGGITRLFAVFRDFDAEKIGPVRSARHYYLDFAFDHDAIYVHYGKSTHAFKKFTEWNSPHLEGLSGLDAVMCFQDPTRVRPHSTYTSYEKLMKTWKQVGYRENIDENFKSKFKFADDELDLVSNMEATYIDLPYSHYEQKPWFEYNEKDKMYYRFQFSGKHIDRETDEQLKFKNIIIQFSNIWTIKGDKYGCMDMSLVDSGDGYYITNGKATKITWKKTSHYQPTLYYNEGGEEIKINRGKTWVSVFPRNRKDKITFTK